MMTTTVSSNGRIVLPAGIRRRDGIRPGQKFEIERIDRGEYRLKLKAQPRNAGLVDLLLGCPIKGYFQPVDRNGITDDVPLPKLR